MRINNHLITMAFVVPFLMFSCSRSGDKTDTPEHSKATQEEIETLANGYDYVDLGICNGLKWATTNVGAENPEDKGISFAWGETEPKPSYSRNNYKYITYNEDIFTKYEDRTKNRDNKIILEPEDDAAHVLRGGGWRIPTEVELDSLMKLCEWRPDTLNGVRGYRVFGQREGYKDKSIFLPVSGAYDQESLKNQNRSGYYWSSTVLPHGVTSAVGLTFDEKDVTKSYYYRYFGQVIRPVFNPTERLVEEVKISTNSLTMLVTDAPVTLSAEAFPTTASNRRIRWVSSDLTVAVATPTGDISVKSKGVCELIAISTDGSNKTATCTLTVVDNLDYDHEYLDMSGETESGLRWATTNVGAESPEDPGLLLTWEEAINFDWGEGWRLPTAEELYSLADNCRHLRKRNGVVGLEMFPTYLSLCALESHLFVPFADKDGQPIKDMDSLTDEEIYCRYWSSTDLPNFPEAAIGISFCKNVSYWNYNLKTMRCYVRPVIDLKGKKR